MYSEILAQRAAENRPVRVGIVGAGKFGSGFVAQIAQMRGMVTAVIADVNVARAQQVYAACSVPLEDQQVVQTLSQLNDAIRQGKPAIVEDALLICQAEMVDVVCEVTGVPEIGARIAYEAISHKKHVVMVNVEELMSRLVPFSAGWQRRLGCLYPGRWRSTGLHYEYDRLGKGTRF